MYALFLKLIALVESWGYLGIFIMTFIESTFVPIPAEITLIPAGYLVAQGEMHWYLVFICSVLGTLGGSLFNYFIAYHFGRKIFIRYGKYFFMDSKKLESIEHFFKKHGAISAFTGRLLPGVKHFISFPAGLAKMPLKVFIFYTVLGASIWCGILIEVGYQIGENEHLIKKYIKQVNIALILFVISLMSFYIWKIGGKKKSK